MTAVLLWKEYRQQRAVWLAIAALAVLLSACLLAWSELHIPSFTQFFALVRCASRAIRFCCCSRCDELIVNHQIDGRDERTKS